MNPPLHLYPLTSSNKDALLFAPNLLLLKEDSEFSFGQVDDLGLALPMDFRQAKKEFVFPASKK